MDIRKNDHFKRVKKIDVIFCILKCIDTEFINDFCFEFCRMLNK